MNNFSIFFTKLKLQERQNYNTSFQLNNTNNVSSIIFESFKSQIVLFFVIKF